MAIWHCPHCGALQAESARCWVCRRSSTTCSTCRNFRPSLTTDVGFCALDRRRRPLTGLELRGCWEGRPAAGDPGLDAPRPTPRPGPAPARAFIPIEDLVAFVAPGPPDAAPLFIEPREPPTSLFGDAEA